MGPLGLDHVDGSIMKFPLGHADGAPVGPCNLHSKMSFGLTNAHRNDRHIPVGAASECALGTLSLDHAVKNTPKLSGTKYLTHLMLSLALGKAVFAT